MHDRRGTTTAVVALGILLIACAALPLVGLIGATGRETAFSESQLLVAVRAHTLLDALEPVALAGWEEPAPERAGEPRVAAPPPPDPVARGGAYTETVTSQ